MKNQFNNTPIYFIEKFAVANVLYERARPGNEANVLYCATVSEPN